jgi:catechol 2,3-dioxygenase-like lactoylglutathione lyase family enzyme
MSPSEERQPILISIAPRSLVREMEQALAFYRQLGFVTTYQDEGFAMVERDGIALHFNVSSEKPPRDHFICWIGVINIETLYQQYTSTGAHLSPLRFHAQPWEMKDFILWDPDRHALFFWERMPMTLSQPTLTSISPRFPVGKMEQAMDFYAQLGFATTTRFQDFARLERDEISLHFNVAEGHQAYWIGVTNIEALYQQYLPTGAIQTPLTSQPWGMKDFVLCDPFGNLLLFGESILEEVSNTNM